jgi:hypothetical protein
VARRERVFLFDLAHDRQVVAAASIALARRHGDHRSVVSVEELARERPTDGAGVAHGIELDLDASVGALAE